MQSLLTMPCCVSRHQDPRSGLQVKFLECKKILRPARVAAWACTRADRSDV